MTGPLWNVIVPCVLCVVQASGESSDKVDKLIKVLQPRTTSVANRALEYRIQEERAWANRMDALNQLMVLGPEAEPAVPLLSRLIEDRYEPKHMKVKMITVLSNIGPSAAKALVAIDRVSASGTPDLKRAADAARWEIKTKAEMIQHIESQREPEIERALNSFDDLGLLGLPVLCRIIDSPNLSAALRDKATASLLKIRSHNTQSLFSLPNEHSYYPFQEFYTKAQDEEIQRVIPVADSHMLARLSEVTSPKIMNQLMIAILRLSKQQMRDPQISQKLADYLNALARPSVDLSQCPDESFKLIDESFGNLAKYPTIQPLARQTMIRFIKSRRDPASFCRSQLLATDLSTSSRMLNLIRNHPDEFLFLKAAPDLSAKRFAELCLACDGSQVQWLDDYRRVAIWACPQSGSLFGGGGGTNGLPVRVFDVQSGLCLGDLGISLINPVVSQDGKHLLTATTDNVSVWALDPIKLHTQISVSNAVYAAFSPSGDKIHIGSNRDSFDFSARKISIWKTQSGVEVHKDLFATDSFAAVCQSGSLLALLQNQNPNKLIVWDFEKGIEIARVDNPYPHPDELSHSWLLNLIRFSKDDKSLLVFQFDRDLRKISSIHEIDIATGKTGRVNMFNNIFGSVRGMEDKLFGYTFKSVEAVEAKKWRVIDFADLDFDCQIDFSSENHPLNSFLELNRDLNNLNLQMLAPQLLGIQDGARQIVLNTSTNQIDLPLTNDMVGIASHRRVNDRSFAWQSKQGIMIRKMETGEDEKLEGLQSSSILSFIDLDSGPLIALKHHGSIQIVRVQSLPKLFHNLEVKNE